MESACAKDIGGEVEKPPLMVEEGVGVSAMEETRGKDQAQKRIALDTIMKFMRRESTFDFIDMKGYSSHQVFIDKRMSHRLCN